MSAHQLNCDSSTTTASASPPSTKYSTPRSIDRRLLSASRIVSTLQTSFDESKKHEQRVRGRLARQISQTNNLAARLKEEENRNERLCRAIRLDDGLSAVSSSSESGEMKVNAGIPPSAFHDLRDSFHSMSPMLIQYKYIDIFHIIKM